MTVQNAAKLRYSAIRRDSFTDGPDGPRTVLWLQGCLLRCPGCQNPTLWDPTGGIEDNAWDLAERLRNWAVDQNITITGGEPLLQTKGVSELVANIRALDRRDGRPRRNIILYTGLKWSQIWGKAIHGGDSGMMPLLLLLDVIVDGPYIAKLDSDFMQYRGSSNQRAIDVAATLEQGVVVELDWDAPDFTIDETGAIIAAAGWMDALGLGGDEIARCGEAGV